MKFSRYINEIKKHKKTILLTALAVISLISIMSVGPTYAYLKMDSAPTVNSFSAAQSVDPAIAETFNRTSKNDVYVRVGDTGYSVYVRAAVVVTWKDADGNVLGTQPREGTDYTIDIGDHWALDSGYYYYDQAVNSGASTENLIESCTVLLPAPEDGYSLSVDILTQTIQSAGETDGGVSAVQDAWGYAFS